MVNKVVAYIREDWKKTNIRMRERNLREYEGKRGKGHAYYYVAGSWLAVGMIFGGTVLAIAGGEVAIGVVGIILCALLGWFNYKTDTKAGASEGIRQALIQYNKEKLQKLYNTDGTRSNLP